MGLAMMLVVQSAWRTEPMLEDINIFTGLSILLFFASFMAAMELAMWVETRKPRRK